MVFDTAALSQQREYSGLEITKSSDEAGYGGPTNLAGTMEDSGCVGEWFASRKRFQAVGALDDTPARIWKPRLR